MEGSTGKEVDARKAWAVGGVVAACLAVWQWPNVADFAQTVSRNNEEDRARYEIVATREAKEQARKDALAAREKAIGVRGAIDEIMAKKALTLDDSASLYEALDAYADSLGADAMTFNPAGAPLFKGPQAKYLERAFRRTQETPTGDLSLAVASSPISPPKAPVVASAGVWRTVAHFTGRSIKSTPRFDVASEEWRIRWKVKGDGIFQIYAYGPDGMPQPAANVQGSDADESYIHGAGSYYLDFNSTGERYEVWVEIPG